MRKITSYKHRISFDVVAILFLFDCNLLYEMRTNHLFFPDLIRVIIVLIIIVYIWNEFHLWTWFRRLNRPDYK